MKILFLQCIVAIALCTVVCIGYVNASCHVHYTCHHLVKKYRPRFVSLATMHVQLLQEISVYCSVEELCGSTGWTRVGIADFQIPCPGGLIEDEVCACKRVIIWS